jgi:hypothetical protein
MERHNAINHHSVREAPIVLLMRDSAVAGISRLSKDERLVRNNIKLSSRIGRDER